MVSEIKTYFEVQSGVLKGTVLEPIFAFIAVKYPHRKTKDLYVPPMEGKDGKKHGWHCCQENCPNPNFEGSIPELLKHLELHAGRLLKNKVSPPTQSK